jgi:hypothetical protein
MPGKLLILPLRLRVEVPEFTGPELELPEISVPIAPAPPGPPPPPPPPPPGQPPPPQPPPTTSIRFVDLRGILPTAPQNRPSPATAPKGSVTVHWLGGAFDRAASDNDAIAYLTQIAREHIARNWGAGFGGSGIMYHEAIGPNGTAFILRDFNEILWHANHNEANRSSHAELVMSGPGSPETDAQLATLRRRLVDFQVPVFGHREWSSTACPGERLMGVVRDTR